MASTATPLQALNWAKRFAGDGAIDAAETKILVLNSASNRLWMFAPWRWSIGQLGNVTLVEDQDDYTISDPGDVLYPVHAEIRHSNRQQITPVKVVHSLSDGAIPKGTPTSLALTAATNIRLQPAPSGRDSSDVGTLLTWYKKINVEIVETGATGNQADDDDEAALLFPDEWFWVYQELVLYYAYKFMGDQRAGGVRVDANGRGQASTYTGQLAEAMDAMLQMSRKEPLFLDDLGRGVNG